MSFSQSKQLAEDVRKKLTEMLGMWKKRDEATKKNTEEVVKTEVGKVYQTLTKALGKEKHGRQLNVLWKLRLKKTRE